MKKIVLLFLILGFALTGFSQEEGVSTEIWPIQKKTKTFGAQFAVTERSDYLLRLGMGYFFTNRFALGTDVRLASREWNLEIQGRYYFPIVDRTYLFAQAAISLDNNLPIIFTLGPGISYFFNERVGVEGTLNNLSGGGIGLVFLF